MVLINDACFIFLPTNDVLPSTNHLTLVSSTNEIYLYLANHLDFAGVMAVFLPVLPGHLQLIRHLYGDTESWLEGGRGLDAHKYTHTTIYG